MSSPLLIPSVVHHQRVTLAKLGYPLVKVKTATKQAYEVGWTQPGNARTIEQWEADWTTDGELNTGLLTNGMRAIDIDIDDPALADFVVNECKTILGPAPKRGRANSGRCMLLYRSDKASPKARKLTGTLGSVEARGNGQMFVCHGIHESGVLYQWDADLRSIPRESLTEVNDSQIELFFEAIHVRLGAESPYNKVRVQIPIVDVQDSTVVPAVTAREVACAQAALHSEVGKLSALRAGSGRNDALNVAAHSLGTMTVAGWIEVKTVAYALFDAAVANGYVSKRGEDAAKKTIMSGLNAGAAKPRIPLALSDNSEQIDISNLSVGGKPVSVALVAGKVSADTGKPQGKRVVVLTGLSGVQATAIQWHWPGYLPAGMLTLLSGAGGTGKSTLAFNFAAAITTGGLWPDGQRCLSAGNVLIWSSEDSAEHTIKPRLIAAGADTNRIAMVESTISGDGERLPFDPSHDIEALRDAVSQIGGISMLIIDPIVSAVSGDMHKANDVRRSLQPIVEFAKEFGCAVLGITHFAKNTGGKNASERVIGSQAFAALARMVLVTAKEEDSDQRVFTRAKSNISADDGGLHYTIEQISIPAHGSGTLQTTRVVWGDAIAGTARSILSSVEGEETEHYGKKMDEAKNFLYNVLANGALPVSQVKMQARNARIASATLQRAKDAMNIQSAKSKGEFVGGWDWMLPAQQLAPPIDLLR